MTKTQPQGFLALPPDGSAPGILVLHPWWGLNETIKAFCLRLSQAGFVTYAPDLYHGQLAVTIPEAESLSNALEVKPARADIDAAAALLDQRAAKTGQGLAVIGFSLGAFFALDLSIRHPDLFQTVVVYYGTGPGDFSTSQAAYLGHFAENDPYEPESNVSGLEAALRKAGRPATFYRYPGTGHWFCEPDRTEAYHPAAAALAWERTLAFLKNAFTTGPE
ncbi:MAG TPA: dienelactone hydrolase family protein [Anaerolineales bacterium]|nr:dienelactone hydrolase family protein [Anaerolineales bacterium]